jgi:lipoate-protein ligase A
MFNAEKIPALGVRSRRPAEGASHMAADEAMMRLARQPTLCWYRWARPEVSFGYPMRWRAVEPLLEGRPAVRRWTGGGLVEHGDDLTLAIAMPTDFAPGTPGAFYERVHSAIAEALGGTETELATGCGNPAGGDCFANPVCHDVLVARRKVAGGAIRRCREGLLYQGSIQSVALPADFIAQLCARLSVHSVDAAPSPEEISLAEALRVMRYGNPEWLARR